MMGDWRIKSMSTIGILLKGAGIPKGSVQETGLNAIRYGELYTDFNVIIRDVRSHISEKTAKESVKIKKGDILFAGSGETIDDIGKSAVYLLGTEGYAGGDIIIFRPNNESCDPIFLAYLLNSDMVRKQLRRLGQGQSIVHIYKRDLEQLELALPDKAEQQRIVKIIETWASYIELLDKKIALKERLKKGLMQQLLTGKKRLPGFTASWRKMKIGDIGTVVSGGTPDTTVPEYWNGEINWITPSEITKVGRKITKPTEKQITSLGQRASAATLIPSNSIILCSRATIGACAVNTYPITTNQGFKNIVPNASIVSTWFLYYWILHNKNLFLRISSGSTFMEFSKKDLEKISIYLPDFEEQQKIEKILLTIDDEIEQLRSKKYILRSQKEYLLKNLISGSIRVPETSDGKRRQKETVYA